VDQLHRIAQLLGDGLNLAGVAAVLELERVNARLRAENRRMRARDREVRLTDPAAPAHGDPAR
jgi:hypothetical protein